MSSDIDHISPEERIFKDLYFQYHQRVYGYVLAIVHLPYAAEEITQELFIKLWTNRYELGGIDHPDRYLFTIARNKSLNYLRKAFHDAKVLSELKAAMRPAANDVEDRVAMDDCRLLVDEALDRLSPQRGLVFRLSRYEGLRLEEIADRLDLSRNTVKNHLVTALRFVRAYLAKHGVTLLALSLLLSR